MSSFLELDRLLMSPARCTCCPFFSSAQVRSSLGGVGRWAWQVGELVRAVHNLSYFCFSNRCSDAVARVKQIKLQHEIELPAGSWGIQMQRAKMDGKGELWWWSRSSIHKIHSGPGLQLLPLPERTGRGWTQDSADFKLLLPPPFTWLKKVKKKK